MTQKTNIENLNSILETVNSLPEAGSGGGSGGGISAAEISLRVQSSPTATTKYASKVVCTTANSSLLPSVNTITSFSYMNFFGAVPNTLIFIKTANNPTSCIVSGDLELIEFVSSSHAIIRVAEDGEISGSSSGEADFPDFPGEVPSQPDTEVRKREITIG